MKKKLLIALGVVAALVLVFVIVVATRPSEFLVARSVTMSAPASAIFPHVNELKKWAAWNPWEKLDPNMKLTYDGPAAGVGATYAWTGNNDVGEGRMTITGSRPHESVQFKLEFFKPMAGVSTTEFTFLPANPGTTVTWSMKGENNFIGRAMCLFMDMDKMIGGNFEQGLASLKAIVEQPAKP
jgi:hypothetical protein